MDLKYRARDLPSAGSHSKKATTAGPGPSQSQEPRTASRSPPGITGSPALGLSSAPLQGIFAGC